MPTTAAAEVDGVGPVEQMVDAGMGLVGGAEHRLRLAPPVGLEDRLDGHGRDQEALRVAQADALAGAHAVGELAATSSVTGIGQSVPSARRIRSSTGS